MAGKFGPSADAFEQMPRAGGDCKGAHIRRGYQLKGAGFDHPDRELGTPCIREGTRKGETGDAAADNRDVKHLRRARA